TIPNPREECKPASIFDLSDDGEELEEVGEEELEIEQASLAWLLVGLHGLPCMAWFTSGLAWFLVGLACFSWLGPVFHLAWSGL
ncbi:hypothetical protein Q8G41_28440, partial [Klebsiella pneumoniae]|uniref:hypothetical protein n=1 Tax=Klebsiella pneumoniae TaxID=573 RepID=UPI0030132924